MATPQDIAGLGLDVAQLRKDTAEALGYYQQVIDAVKKIESLKVSAGNYGDLLTKQKELIENSNKLATAFDNVSKASNNSAGNTKKQLDAFQQLVKAQKEAEASANSLAVSLGRDSEEYKTAAANAALLKQQILDIKAATAAGGATAVPVVSTTNIPDLEAEQAAIQQTTTVVSELEQQEAAATVAANEWAAAQRAAAAGTTAATVATEEELTAYQTLAQTLISIEAELSATNAAIKQNALAFKQGAISEEQYIAEATKLTITQAELKTTLAATRAELTAQAKIITGVSGAYDLLNARYIEAKKNAQDIATAFGYEAVQAKRAAAEAFALGQQLKNIDASTNQFTKNVGNYGNAFTKGFGLIRQAAYILPGIGIAGIFNLLYEGLSKVVTELYVSVPAFNAAKEAHRNWVDVVQDAQKSSEKEIINLKVLEKAVTDETLPRETRLKIVKEMQKEYPNYLGNLSQEAILSGQAAEQIQKLADALFKKALVEAEANKAAELGLKNLELQDKQRFLFDEQKKAIQEVNKQQKIQTDLTAQQAQSQGSLVGQVGLTNPLLLRATEHLQEINDLMQDNGLQQQSTNVQIQRYIDNIAKAQPLLQSLEKPDKGLQDAASKYNDYLQKLIKARRDAEIQALQDEAKIREGFASSTGFGADERMLQEKKASALRLQIIKINEQAELDLNRQSLQKILDDKKISNTDKNIADAAAQQDRLNIIAEGERKVRDEIIASEVKIADIRKAGKDIEKKATADAEAYFKNYADTVEKNKEAAKRASGELTKFNIGVIEGGAALEQQAREIAYTKAQAALTQQYNDGLIGKRRFEIAKRDLEIAYSRESLKAAIAAAEAELKLLSPATKAFNDLQQKIASANLALKNLDTKTADNKLSDLAATLDIVAQATQNITSALSAINNISYDNQKAALQELEAQQQKNYDQEVANINNSVLSAQQKADKLKILEQTRQAQKDANDRKQRAADNAKARFDKELSILNIITGTAVAVVKALPNIPLAITVGLLGAAELVAAVATKIPQYKHGLKGDKPAHFAIHGEAGPELVEKPGLAPFISDTPTFDFLPANTKITPFTNTDINEFVNRALYKQTAQLLQQSRQQEQKGSDAWTIAKYQVSEYKKAMKRYRAPAQRDSAAEYAKQLAHLLYRQSKTNW